MAATKISNLPTKPSAALIAGRTLKEIIWSPIVYLPYAAAAITNAALPLPAWIPISAALSITAGQVWWWRRNWDHIFERHEAHVEAQYRQAFNEALYNEVPLGNPASRAILELIETKTAIENKILEDDRISTKEREILDLIEVTALQAVQTAKTLSMGSRAKVPADIVDACEALKEMHQDLGFILRPLNPTESEQVTQVKTGLAQSTQALRHRMDEARGVREMVEEVKRPRTRA